LKFIASFAGRDGIDRQVAKKNSCGLAMQGFQSGHEFEEIGAA
jgi:hypothetical protein